MKSGSMEKLSLFFRETKEKYKKFNLEFFPVVLNGKLLEVECRFNPKPFNIRWGKWPQEAAAGKILWASKQQVIADISKDKIQFGIAKFIINPNSAFSEDRIIEGLDTFVKLLMEQKK